MIKLRANIYINSSPNEDDGYLEGYVVISGEGEIILSFPTFGDNEEELRKIAAEDAEIMLRQKEIKFDSLIIVG